MSWQGAEGLIRCEGCSVFMSDDDPSLKDDRRRLLLTSVLLLPNERPCFRMTGQ